MGFPIVPEVVQTVVREICIPVAISVSFGLFPGIVPVYNDPRVSIPRLVLWRHRRERPESLLLLSQVRLHSWPSRDRKLIWKLIFDVKVIGAPAKWLAIALLRNR